MNQMIFVTLVGDMVSACNNQDTAVTHLQQMLTGEVIHHIESARECGDARKAVKVRTVYVELHGR